MNYTEQQIIEIAKKVMKDLDGKYYSENCIGDLYFDNENIIPGENKGKSHPKWTISINAIFDNLDFLHISDETGEPLYYQNFNTFVFEIEKDKEEKYYMVKEQ